MNRGIASGRFCSSTFATQHRILFLCLLLLVFSTAAGATTIRAPENTSIPTKRSTAAMKAALPNDFFERNVGQADAGVLFVAKQGHGRIAIRDDGIEWSDQPISSAEHRVLRLTWGTWDRSTKTALHAENATGGR
jgi:hypothetical protein